MHEEMYMNSQIQSNVLNLSKNHYIVGPRYGNLDIGDKGLGRLIEPDELLGVLNKQKGKIIVTSGPTYEEIDDVKVVTNKSSGKQGRALAIELSARGYEIIYIHSSSIDHIPGLDNVSFHSSNDLFVTTFTSSISSYVGPEVTMILPFCLFSTPNNSSGSISLPNPLSPISKFPYLGPTI